MNASKNQNNLKVLYEQKLKHYIIVFRTIPSQTTELQTWFNALSPEQKKAITWIDKYYPITNRKEMWRALKDDNAYDDPITLAKTYITIKTLIL
jgi:hypothetical protein